MLIKNITILDFENLSTQENLDIKIEQNKIVKVGVINDSDSEVIDGSSLYVIPGLINTHAHTAMVFLRGSAEDVTSSDWFNNHIWIYEKNIQKGDVYLGTLLGAIEMISSGITTVFDHYFNMEEALSAYKDLGMRADLSYTMFGAGENAQENFKNAMNFIEKYNGVNELFTISLGPHSPYVCPKEFLEDISRIRIDLGLKVHLHISEEPWQVEKSIKEYGMTPIEFIDSIGLLDENTILAHAYYSTDSDLDLIKKRNSNIAHAPKTYLKFAWVNNFLNRAIEKDVNVSFATDGAASNSNYSIFEVSRLSAFLGKVASGNPTSTKIGDVLRLFAKGEKFLKKPISKIKVGYLADLVFLDKYSPRLNPTINIFANILYSISEADIRMVMINGKIVYKDGEIFGYKKERIIESINKVGKRLVRKNTDKPMQMFG
ncbi:amidohydrolase [Caldisericum exile]|uniref:Hydrolase n=1 Tax=Caldisericum exile (strain DSM 21853 / NBRC 104410 / AZM16c01) TaxID=511051 RepID=A0A7U6GFU0_CALEA|nr:amidohydrolase [Caldisericum exile]BAL81595.1 putative hydrolase [Caldisericum exile AZM16c01]